MTGTDPTKKWQRNIRIEPELWAFVQSIAPKGHSKNGNCYTVIRNLIIKAKLRHDALIARRLQRTKLRQAKERGENDNTLTDRY